MKPYTVYMSMCMSLCPAVTVLSLSSGRSYHLSVCEETQSLRSWRSIGHSSMVSPRSGHLPQIPPHNVNVPVKQQEYAVQQQKYVPLLTICVCV